MTATDIIVHSFDILEWEEPPRMTRDLYLIWQDGDVPVCCLTGLIALSFIMLENFDSILLYENQFKRGFTREEIYKVLQRAGFSKSTIYLIESMYMGTYCVSADLRFPGEDKKMLIERAANISSLSRDVVPLTWPDNARAESVLKYSICLVL
jgi:hypothetical protein